MGRHMGLKAILLFLTAVAMLGMTVWMASEQHVCPGTRVFHRGASYQGASPQAHQELKFSERETARRRAEDTATELLYFMHAAMNKMRNASNASSSLADSLQDVLQGYHVALMRDLHAVRHVTGDEEWREAESRRLSDLVQRRLDFLQNPADCARAKMVVCDLRQNCGFGCKLHHVVSCLHFAYATGRTFVLEDAHLQYKVTDGWRTFFRPLSDTCPTVSRPAVDYNALKSLDQLESTPVVHMPVLKDFRGRRPIFGPPAVPADLAPRVAAFHANPFLWWIGQLVHYVMRPNEELTRVMNDTVHETGFRHPIVGVQIRWTDKVDPRTGEAPGSHSLQEYMAAVEIYFRQRNVTGSERRVYLATDDPGVLPMARKMYPDYVFIGNTSFSELASVKLRYSAHSLEGIIMDIMLLSRTDYIVCTFSSNIGRAVYELMQTHHGDASTYYRSLDDVYFYHGQNPHNLTVIEAHQAAQDQAQDPSQLALKVGDVLKSVGNYWEGGRGVTSGRNWKGLTDAYNYRTYRRGLFPSHKAVSQLLAVPMPTYPEVPDPR